MSENKTYSAKEAEVFEGVLSLAEQGSDLTSLTVKQIADAAGMGKGTLYEYFRSKEEILMHTIAYCAGRETERMAEYLKPQREFRVTLEECMNYFEQMVETRAASYFVILSALNPGTLGEHDGCDMIRLQFHNVLMPALEALYQKGLQSGHIDENCSYEFFSYAFCTGMMDFVSGLVRLKMNEKNKNSFLTPSRDTLRQYTLRMILGAIKY